MLITYLALFMQKRTWPWYLDFIHGEGLNAVINKASFFKIHMITMHKKIRIVNAMKESIA